MAVPILADDDVDRLANLSALVGEMKRALIGAARNVIFSPAPQRMPA